MSENFAELFEASFNNRLYSSGEIIPATVIKIEKDVIYLDAGTKSEAYVEASQFKAPEGDLTVEIGEVVNVYLEMPVDGLGETRLSRDKAERLETWARLKEALGSEEIIKGVVVQAVRGGLSLDIGKIRAFLPRSLVSTHSVDNLEDMIGQVLEVRVLNLDEEKSSLIVSRRAVLEEALKIERDELLSKIEIGDIVKGVVKNLTDYGAFIDLGGIDGLLHITDMAWKRVNHPSEIVEIDQEVEVKVMKLDKERSRLSLGLKQLQEDPWANIEERFPVDTVIHGCKVSNIMDYGAFVAIESMIDGLVHTSEFDWNNRNVHPNKLLHMDQEVDVKVIEIDVPRRRISLSIKQCTPNPWQTFADAHQRGTKVTGKVRSKTDFGLFLGLEGGIDGLVHVSDLSWNTNSDKLLSEYSKGDEVEAVVLNIDIDRERISLGIKQLTTNEFMEFATAHPKSSIVSGTVTEVSDKGATITLAEGVTGSLKRSEWLEELEVGSEVKSTIRNIDRKNRRIFLSVKLLNEAEEKQAIKEYKKSSQESEKENRNTLGSLIGKTLEQSDTESES